MLLFQVFSPIDIQIVAPDGKRAGKNFETGEIYDEIKGAYYTGYDTNAEFVTIPNPIDGEYQILTQGTDKGNYKVEATNISENDEGEAMEKTLVFEGVTTEGEKFAYRLVTKNSDILKIETTDSDDENIDNEYSDKDVDNGEKESVSSSESNDNQDILDNNNDDELRVVKKDSDKKPKHKGKKKKKRNNDLTLANGENNNATANTNADKKQTEKRQENNTEINGIKSAVKGEDVTDNEEVSGEQNIVDDGKKSFFAFGAIILIGLALLVGNLFGWLKTKNKKDGNDDF